nr:oxidoreductase [Propionibacterium sp.]
MTVPAGPPPGRHRRRAARRHLVRDGLQVLAWVSIAVPVAVWLAGGGLAGVATVAGALTAAGIVTGLVATASVVLMLWLSARVPVIDRAIGQDRAIALHARLGQVTFGGLVAHGLFLVAGYALADGRGPVAEFLDLWGVGDFTLAVAAIGLLAAVSASSVVAARRKLPFEAWHAIHLLSYAAVLASLPHQFSMGGLFASGVAHWCWVAVWLATFGVLLAFRIFTPLFASIEHRLVVSSVVRTGDVATITMTGRRLDRLGAAAGQYFHWRFLARGLWWHQHPFSLSAAPRGDTLRISVRNLGAGSAALLDVAPGTPVAFEGPYGIFSDAARTADDVVLVGIGIGIAPVRAVLEGTDFAPGRATVILRASHPEELYLRDEIEDLCCAKGARLYTLIGHRGHDAAGRPVWGPEQDAHVRLADLCPRVADADVYVCGPAAAAGLVVADARAAGTPVDRIHFERFDW